MADNILDLRSLADEWQALLEDEDPDAVDVGAYEELARDLGLVDATPEDLRSWANDYEPTLIREDYFEEYARELAEDIGAISSNAEWPLSYIDWPRAARALAMDYTTVEYAGDTYYIRA